jgi:hypothetical protein
MHPSEQADGNAHLRPSRDGCGRRLAEAWLIARGQRAAFSASRHFALAGASTSSTASAARVKP